MHIGVLFGSFGRNVRWPWFTKSSTRAIYFPKRTTMCIGSFPHSLPIEPASFSLAIGGPVHGSLDPGCGVQQDELTEGLNSSILV